MGTVLRLDFNPNDMDMDQIKLWLSEEWTNSKTGLFHQYAFLLRHQKMGCTAVLKEGEQVITFVAWQPMTRIKTKLEYFSVAPRKRRSGLGRILFGALKDNLAGQGVAVLDMICATDEAELFWYSVGALKFPYLWNYSNPGCVNLFLPLSETEALLSNVYEGARIEITGREYGAGNSEEQHYVWPVHFKSGTRTLEKPIIFPVNMNWRLVWRNETKIFHDGQILDFHGQSNLNEPLMIIKELP